MSHEQITQKIQEFTLKIQDNKNQQENLLDNIKVYVDKLKNNPNVENFVQPVVTVDHRSNDARSFLKAKLEKAIFEHLRDYGFEQPGKEVGEEVAEEDEDEQDF